ncbi:MAG: chromosome segregation protein [Clostridia bacterium]|jgi:chromosome segregation protein|nr:chromosome segregation protein [Clostridia bacterium]
MYLDKIEIHGFKSFGNAVKLNIPKGITGVIGPNGSGKSNVADAIRWVLGEQSAKSLRGSKMEDIIFAGTEKRKSLGYAEVAMHIKNDDKEVPIAYNEIVIKRRVYRSGESEYFINGSSCRLKDVQELFMDTGVGKEGYSIIGQGQIDRVLSSKPEERRTLFEEAAGIYKYKVRRQEAEKKLEKQRENLTRINDIILEIESRLEPLELEAQKTKRFLKLKEELREVDVNIFIYEIDRLEKELVKLVEDIATVDTQINEANLQKELLSQKNTMHKKLKNNLFEDIEGIVHTISELDKDQERKHSQIEITCEKITTIDRLLEQIKKDKETRQIDHQNKIDKLNMLQSKKTALEIEQVSKADIMAAETERLEQMTQLLNDVENNIGSSKEELYKNIREIDLLRSEILRCDETEAGFEYRISQIEENIAILNSEIQHEEVSIKVLNQSKSEVKGEQDQNENELKQVEQSKSELAQAKSNIEKELSICEQNYVQADRQFKWLMHIKEEHEGYFSSVKEVLNIVKKDAARWKGIIGVVGELLEVPKEYETAIVTALGSSIQYIVTLSEDYARDMINLMKQKGISRVTFLPKDTVTRANAIQESAICKEPGFLGIASELIAYDKSYSDIISSLLGRIIIVDDIKNASNIARKYKYKYKLVTLDGEIFNSGGSLSGGSTKNQKNNIFSRNREIKELQQKVIIFKEQSDRLSKDLILLAQNIENINEKWDTLHNKLVELGDKEKSIVLELEKNIQKIKLTKNTQLQLITEKNTLEDTIEELKRSREQMTSQLEEAEEDIKKDKDSLQTLERDLFELRTNKEQIAKELTEKKIDLSSTEQNIKHIFEQIKELKDQLEHQDEKYIKQEESIQNYKSDKQILLENNEMMKKEIAVLEEKIIEYNMKRADYDAKKAALEADEIKIQEATEEVLEQLDKLKEEKYRLDNKKQNWDLQKQNWCNSMWEQYEITYNHALTYQKELGSISELKKLSVDMKIQIKQIGNVNVNALEEYNETKTRYEFLNSQKEDIEKAETTLLQMIENLTHQMKEIFSVQFKSIAINFTAVFRELFGGGEAYLELSDEQNILESGIEIIAKPPGKKLQNMSLLSGGERTLTAISLLFGILKLKPSPFCVLDEIESALDDANVLRFAEYLHKLADETQFIVITHRKGTMERAHTLYGVTMQERGVSTVLSIQLEDAKIYLDEKKTS